MVGFPQFADLLSHPFLQFLNRCLVLLQHSALPVDDFSELVPTGECSFFIGRVVLAHPDIYLGEMQCGAHRLPRQSQVSMASVFLAVDDAVLSAVHGLHQLLHVLPQVRVFGIDFGQLALEETIVVP